MERTRAKRQYLENDPQLIALYRALEARLLAHWPGSVVVVQKSQIAFLDPRPFCYLWLPPVGRRRPGRPERYLVLTLVLSSRRQHRLLAEVSDPYPARFSHHFIVAEPNDLDERLLDLVAEANARSSGTNG